MTSIPFRTSALAATLRAVAFGGMVGTALIGQSMLASAQPVPTVKLVQATPTKAATGATEGRTETVEQRITALHTALKITPAEETDWTGVAQAMRDNASAMDKLRADKASVDPKTMSAVDDLKTYAAFAQTHVDGLKNLSTAFEALYVKMPDPQKKIADQVFQNANRRTAAAHS